MTRHAESCEPRRGAGIVVDMNSNDNARAPWPGLTIQITDQRDESAAALENGGDYTPAIIGTAYDDTQDPTTPIATIHLGYPADDYNDGTLRIDLISTDINYRRRGVATTLVTRVREHLGTPIIHSNPAHRSRDGEAWATALPLDGEEGDGDYPTCDDCGNRDDICMC